MCHTQPQVQDSPPPPNVVQNNPDSARFVSHLMSEAPDMPTRATQQSNNLPKNVMLYDGPRLVYTYPLSPVATAEKKITHWRCHP